MKHVIKKAVIVGASSGMGLEVARLLLAQGAVLGLAARRAEPLQKLSEEFPGQVFVERIDITADDAGAKLKALISRMGGMELYFHVSGIGFQNMTLDIQKETSTVSTNVLGFTRMVDAAYQYFAEHGGGHIAILSSIAGTKGLGAAPAYSATKAFQNVYLQALEQQAKMRHLNIAFTDIRPGFVDTALLNDGKTYPMLMRPQAVARQIVRALNQKKHVKVIDWRYRVLTALWRRLPRWVWRNMSIHT